MIARCAVCARLEAGDERVELLPAMFVHRGHCLARWLRAKPPQRVAWTARAERWIGPLTISRKFPFCPRPGRPPDTDRMRRLTRVDAPGTVRKVGREENGHIGLGVAIQVRTHFIAAAHRARSSPGGRAY
jgi:hypothetical protein